MKENTLKQSRRKFLKGFAYSAGLSVLGMTAQAFAAAIPNPEDLAKYQGAKELANEGIGIMQQKTLDGEIVTLINESSSTIMLDVAQPVNFQMYQGNLIVRANRNTSEANNGMLAFSPGERVSFDVTGVDDSHLQITSENSVFNRTIPVGVV